MAARLRLTESRAQRLVALLEFGEPLAGAARAVGVSRKTVYRHRREDPVFAARLEAARGQITPSGALFPAAEVVALDWQVIAAQLERDYPERRGGLGEWDD